MGWGRYPNWLGYAFPFKDRPDIRWPILWSEAQPNAKYLPGATVFCDRFWDAMEHWLPVGASTDPYGIKVWKGEPAAPHSGVPIGTPEEYLSGLSYTKWLAGGYADRPSETCVLKITFDDEIRAAGSVDSFETSGPYYMDRIDGAGLVDSTETSRLREVDSIDAAAMLESNEHAARFVDDSIDGASSLESIETSSLLEVATIEGAVAASSIETQEALEIATVGKASAVVSAESVAYLVFDEILKASQLTSTETFVEGDIGVWNKYTLPYTSFQTAGTSITVTVAAVPGLTWLHDAAFNITTNFTGGAIVSITVQPKFDTSNMGISFSGHTGNNGSIISDNGSVSKGSLPNGTNLGLGSFTVSKNVVITMTSVGANLSALTAGSIDVWLCTSTLP